MAFQLFRRESSTLKLKNSSKTQVSSGFYDEKGETKPITLFQNLTYNIIQSIQYSELESQVNKKRWFYKFRFSKCGIC